MFLQNTRHFIQDQYDEYHYVKVLICGIIIVYTYKLILNIVTKYFSTNKINNSNLCKEIQHIKDNDDSNLCKKIQQIDDCEYKFIPWRALFCYDCYNSNRNMYRQIMISKKVKIEYQKNGFNSQINLPNIIRMTSVSSINDFGLIFTETCMNIFTTGSNNFGYNFGIIDSNFYPNEYSKINPTLQKILIHDFDKVYICSSSDSTNNKNFCDFLDWYLTNRPDNFISEISTHINFYVPMLLKHKNYKSLLIKYNKEFNDNEIIQHCSKNNITFGYVK